MPTMVSGVIAELVALGRTQEGGDIPTQAAIARALGTLITRVETRSIIPDKEIAAVLTMLEFYKHTYRELRREIIHAHPSEEYDNVKPDIVI